MHNTLRHLFLKFNNNNKQRHKKRYKHEIKDNKYPFSPAKKERSIIALKGMKLRASKKRKILKSAQIRSQEILPRVVKPLIFSKQKGWGISPKLSSASSIKTNGQDVQGLKAHKPSKKKKGGRGYYS